MGTGYVSILGESPVFYVDSASQIWGLFFNSCPVEYLYIYNKIKFWR